MKATIPMMATVAMIVATTLFASDAGADGWTPGPWKPSPPSGGPRTYGPKALCPFELRVEVVKNEEMRREYTDGSGKVVALEMVGSLVFRFTDISRGKSVERDANGHGWLFFHPDNSVTHSSVGPFAVPVKTSYHPPNLAPGYYIMSGVTVLHIPEDLKWTIAYTPPFENVCDTLAALPR